MDQRIDRPEPERQAFNSSNPGTWPDGLWGFLKSNIPSTAEIVEAYRAWCEEQECELRIAVLKARLEGGDVKSAKATQRKPSSQARRAASPPWVAEMITAGGALTVGEFALRIRKSERTVHRMINDGRVHAVKQGSADSSTWLIPRSSVEAYLASLD